MFFYISIQEYLAANSSSGILPYMMAVKTNADLVPTTSPQ